MGSWSPTSFGNDNALDLLLELEKAGSCAEVAAVLFEVFEAYGAYDARRRRGENVIILTAERIEHLIAAYDQVEESQDFFESLRGAVGTQITDDGSHEANAVIAAAEIVHALRSRDFGHLHEDGLFLRKFEPDAWQALVEAATASLELVKLNKPLARTSGRKWSANRDAVLGRLRAGGPA